MVLQALDATAREDGWATPSALGSQITRNHPSFDPRNYKEAKVGELMRKQNYLQIANSGTVDQPVRRRDHMDR
jgi:hypothetical protein